MGAKKECELTELQEKIYPTASFTNALYIMERMLNQEEY